MKKKSEPAKGEKKSATKAPAIDPDRVVRVNLADIRRDPGQPRKLPPPGPALDAAIADITGSIDWDLTTDSPVDGRDIITPLELRRTEEGEGSEPWTIVDGERRWWSGKARGFVSLRAIVVDIAPADVLARQVLHAEATKPLTPIERADAIARLAKPAAGKRKPPSAEEIGFRIGCSAKEVRRSLAIASLCPEARAALALGAGDEKGIGIAVALMLSTIADPKEQSARTHTVLGCDVRNAAWKIDQARLTLAPSATGFDPEDASLAGGACSKCPHNTASQRTLGILDDEGAQRAMCSKASCYEEKRGATWERRKATAAAVGVQVLEGKAGEEVVDRWGNFEREDVVAMDDICDLDEEAARAAKRVPHTWREVLGADAAPSMLVKAEGGRVHEVITLADAAKRLEALGREEDAAKVREELSETPAGGAKLPVFDRGLNSRENAARYEAGRQALVALYSAARAADPDHFLRFMIALWLRIEEDAMDFDSVAEQVRPMLARRGIEVERPETVDEDAYPPELPALLAWVAEQRDPAELQALFAELLSERADIGGRTFLRTPEDMERDPWTVVCRFAGVDWSKLLASKLGTAAPLVDSTGPSSPAKGIDLEEIDRAHQPTTEPRCRVCGCTENHACEGGCSWTSAVAAPGDELCTACAMLMQSIREAVDNDDEGPTREELEESREEIFEGEDAPSEKTWSAAIAYMIRTGELVVLPSKLLATRVDVEPEPLVTSKLRGFLLASVADKPHAEKWIEGTAVKAGYHVADVRDVWGELKASGEVVMVGKGWKAKENHEPPPPEPEPAGKDATEMEAKIIAATAGRWATLQEVKEATGMGAGPALAVLGGLVEAGRIGRQDSPLTGERWSSDAPTETPSPKRLVLKIGDRVRAIRGAQLVGRLGTVAKLCEGTFAGRFYVDFDLLGKERTTKHLQLGPDDVEVIAPAPNATSSAAAEIPEARAPIVAFLFGLAKAEKKRAVATELSTIAAAIREGQHRPGPASEEDAAADYLREKAKLVGEPVKTRLNTAAKGIDNDAHMKVTGGAAA